MFSNQVIEINGKSIPVKFFMDIVPYVDLRIFDNSYQAFIDTGAKISYVHPEITSNLQPVGSEQDFYPLFGVFNVDIYDVPIEIGSHRINLRVGNLPEVLQKMLNMMGGKVIIGCDLLDSFDISFNFTANEMILSILGQR